jgi:hypothetical protein
MLACRMIDGIKKRYRVPGIVTRGDDCCTSLLQKNICLKQNRQWLVTYNDINQRILLCPQGPLTLAKKGWPT